MIARIICVLSVLGAIPNLATAAPVRQSRSYAGSSSNYVSGGYGGRRGYSTGIRGYNGPVYQGVGGIPGSGDVNIFDYLGMTSLIPLYAAMFGEMNAFSNAGGMGNLAIPSAPQPPAGYGDPYGGYGGGYGYGGTGRLTPVFGGFGGL